MKWLLRDSTRGIRLHVSRFRKASLPNDGSLCIELRTHDERLHPQFPPRYREPSDKAWRV